MNDRFELAGIGAFAGLSLWALFEYLPDLVGEGLLLFALTVTTGVFFTVLMALVGPERPARAILPSLGLALVCGVLAYGAGVRFATVDATVQALHPLLALCVLGLLGTPFAAAQLEAPAGWRSYARLFDSAWAIFIRYVAGGLFAGLIFLALLLSDALLKLVGIEAIAQLLEHVWLRYTLAGAVFGLGVATVHELRGYVSPVLVHRLLRMLLPLMLAVVLVFIAALPVRGLSELFGGLSSAGVLMAVAFGGLTLVSTALDRDDAAAAQSRLMRLSAQLMALLLPVLVGLAAYAIWLRVDAYGLTPRRLMAAYSALFLLGYAGSYFWAVLRGSGWQGRLRQTNLRMALAVWGGAVLWLSPLINAEALSARSQLARFEAGASTPEELPLYEMAQRWGKAGQAALHQLDEGGDAALQARIAQARTAGARWQFEQEDGAVQAAALRPLLAARMARRPEGAPLEALLARMEGAALLALARACPEAALETCVFVPLAQGSDPFAAERGLVVTRGSERVFALRAEGRFVVVQPSAAFDDAGRRQAVPEGLFEQVMAGEFAIVPLNRNVISLGDGLFFPYN